MVAANGRVHVSGNIRVSIRVAAAASDCANVIVLMKASEWDERALKLSQPRR